MQPAIENERFGRYRVIREIGRGGMGVVFEARDDDSGKRCALKVLPLGRSRDHKVVTRFTREAEAAQRLDHPNIVKVYELGREGDLYWFAMELVEGRNLEEIIFKLRRNRREFQKFLSTINGETDVDGDGEEPAGRRKVDHRDRRYIDTVVRLLRDVAEALDYSHEQGLIHRDIKPSNLILTRDGRLMVTDFGLVRDLKSRTFTMTGEMLGTPLYMSPEQITARRRNIDGRTDTYSLGATLYEALTLAPPFDGEELPALVRQIQFDDPMPMQRHNERIPAALELVVSQSMAKSPRRRYATASSFAEDLTRYLDHKPVVARPPGRMERWWRKVLAHREVATVLAVAAAVCLFVVGFMVVREMGDRRRSRNQVQTFLDDGRSMLEQGSYGSAWRKSEAILEEDASNVDARDLQRRILDEATRSTEVAARRGGDALSEAFRLTNALQSFAPNDPRVVNVKALVVESLELAVVEELVAERVRRAEDRRQWYRTLVGGDPVAVQRLSEIVADELWRAAGRSYDIFQFEVAQRHMHRAIEAGYQVGPGSDLPRLERLGSKSYRRLEAITREIFSGDEMKSRNALRQELGAPATYVRLPHAEVVRLLRALLGDENFAPSAEEVVRVAGVLKLAELSEDLVDLAKNRPKLVPSVVQALSKIRGSEAVDFLLRVLGGNDDTSVRQKALLALATEDSPEVIARLRSVMADKNYAVGLRVFAAWSLGKLGVAQAAPGMLRLARELDEMHCRRVLHSLVELRTPVDGRQVAEFMTSETSAPVQLECLRLLALSGDEQALARIVSVFETAKEPEERLACVQAMSLVSSSDAYEFLTQRLADPQATPEIRAACAFALDGDRAADAFEIFRGVLLEGGPEIARQAVAFVLGRLDFETLPRARQSEVTGALVQALDNDASTYVQVKAVDALVSLGAWWTAPKLVEIVASFEPESDLLSQLFGTRTREDPLAEFYEKNGIGPILFPGFAGQMAGSGSLVASACRALGRFAAESRWTSSRREGAVRAIQKLLAHPETPVPVRRVAIEALGRFDGFAPSSEVGRFLDDDRLGGVTALAMARLGDPAAAHRYFEERNMLNGEDCFVQALVWSLERDVERGATWLFRAWLLGFDDWERLDIEPEAENVVDSEPVRRLMDRIRRDRRVRGRNEE